MDSTGEDAPNGPATGAAGAVPSLRELARWREALGDVGRGLCDADRIDQLRALEELKAAACAAQARIAVDLAASQQREQAAAGVPAARRGGGVAAQVALARRESPARGGRLLGLAKAVVEEMPHTHAALSQGRISEWRATLLVRESACLSREDRAAFDAALVADPSSLDGVGDRRLVARAKQIAYRLDAASVVRRARRAEGERRVSLRPAPDTMSYLTGLLPVAQGVSVLAALTREADALRAQGDSRSRSQIMADVLVERVTGRERAADVPVEIQLVITDRALLGGADDPATIPGYGTVPALWARRLIAGPGKSEARTEDRSVGRARRWLRRVLTEPTTGRLVGLESSRRAAPAGLARFIDIRDQSCRSPWCDAPIRHRDHVQAHADGGRTSAENLQGLCEACNYAKQMPGWSARAGPGSTGHRVTTTTPTGHEYRSESDPLPGPGGRDGEKYRPGGQMRCVIDVVRAA